MQRPDKENITASIVLYKNDSVMVRHVVECVIQTELISALYIIDNSPNDSLQEVCKGDICNYRYLGKNIGFGPGHNLAITEATGAYHVIINPDISFDRNSLEAMIKFMNNNINVGLLSPKVCFPDGTVQYLCRRYPSLYILIVRRFMPSFLRKYFQSSLDYSEMRDTGYDRIMDIQFATGCFMFLRCSVLNSVKGFDEQFFLYFEDMDLSYRISKISRVVFYPDSVVFHHWKRGSYKSLRLTIYNIISSLKFFNKHGCKLF